MDLQTYFCGRDWLSGEVDGFFTVLTKWICYYNNAWKIIGEHKLPDPSDVIIDNPDKFYEWAEKMIEANNNKKR